MAASSQDQSFEKLFMHVTDRKNKELVPLCKLCTDRHNGTVVISKEKSKGKSAVVVPAEFLCQTCGVTLCVGCIIDKQHSMHDKMHLKNVFHDMFNAAADATVILPQDRHNKKIPANNMQCSVLDLKNLVESTYKKIVETSETQTLTKSEISRNSGLEVPQSSTSQKVKTVKSNETLKSEGKASMKPSELEASRPGASVKLDLKVEPPSIKMTSKPETKVPGQEIGITRPKPSDTPKSVTQSARRPTRKSPVNRKGQTVEHDPHLNEKSVLGLTLFNSTITPSHKLVVSDFDKLINNSLCDLKWPYGLCASASGSIFIADTYNHRLQIVRDSGPESLYPSQDLLYPCGITYLENSPETIVVADSGNGVVKVMKSGGNILQTIDDQLARPHGVTWSCWYMYITDISKRTITKHSVATGKVVQTLSAPNQGMPRECQMKQPSYIDSSKDGRSIFVSDSIGGCVKVYDIRNNAAVRTFPSFSIPQGICLGPQDNTLVVADFAQSRVDVLDLRNGMKVTQIAGSNHGVIGPTDLAYHALSRRALVLDTTRGRVLHFPILPQVPNDEDIFDSSFSQHHKVWLNKPTPSIVFQTQN